MEGARFKFYGLELLLADSDAFGIFAGVEAALAQTPIRPLLLEALKVRPDSAPAEHELGRAAYHAGNYQGALVHLEAAKRRDPESRAISLLLANTYRRSGREAQEIEEFERGRALTIQELKRVPQAPPAEAKP